MSGSSREAERLADKLANRYPDAYFVLAFRGMSGTMLGTMLASKLCEIGRSPGMIYVRKDGEMSGSDRCHSGSRAEVLVDKHRGDKAMVVFVDDFVASGATRRKVLGAVATAGYRTDITIDVTFGGSQYGKQTPNNGQVSVTRDWPR